MESPIFRQISEFIQRQKNHKRWMVVFAFMAVIVGLGTFTALRMMGQAMTHKERVLDCQLALHEHDKACYDENNLLICGYADYVVHKHNDDCYNSDRKLVCRLPEIEKHEHTDKCYDKVVTLVCGKEESAGHEHTKDCYSKQQGALKCKEKEHAHSDSCYDEEGNLTCNLEEHQHDDGCYETEEVLTCKKEEGEGGHTHTDACFVEEEGLICGELEMHTHTDKCFEKIDKDGKDEPENLRLICGKIQLEEHVHTEAAGCLHTREVIPDSEILQTTDDEDIASGDDGGVFTTDLNGEGTDGEDGTAPDGENADGENGETPDGETTDGEAADGEGTEDGEAGEDAGTGEGTEGENGEVVDTEPEDYELSKTYEGLGYIVTASYNEDANIPEDAKLVAEQITKESDEEKYKAHEEEFKKNMGDEEATLSALFKIGFYVDGEEVEPETPVLVTIQFVDKNGLPEGAPVKVVHFGEEGTEVIDGSNASGGSTSFKTRGFSIFGVGYGKKADAEEASVHISESFEYDEEMFHITFQVEGPIKLADDEKNIENAENGEVAKEDIPEQDTAEGTSEEQVSEDKVSEDANEKEDDEKKDTASSEDKKDNDFSLDVELLDEESEEYQAANTYVEEISEGSELLFVHAIRYSMTYKGSEVDLSQCKVTARVTPTEKLSKYAEEMVIGEAEKEDIVLESKDVDIEIAAVSVSPAMEVKRSGLMRLADDSDEENMDVVANDGVMAFGITSSTNPTFNVQYYAWINRMELGAPVATEGMVITDTAWNNKPFDDAYQQSIRNNVLPFINTKGAKLPTNGTVPATTGISLVNNKVKTNNELTKVYEQMPYEYIKAPAMKYFNVLAGNGGYELKEVWVLKPGYSADSAKVVEENEEAEMQKWNVYSKSDFDKLHFTNRQSTVDKAESGETYVLIDSKTIIRLVYDVTNGMRNQPATFFDYDISDGNHINGTISANGNKTAGKIMNTKEQGINSSQNCEAGTKYAFGNNNTGTGHGTDEYNGNRFNMTNKYKAATYGAGYAGCSFGLVSGASGDNVIFNVDAPQVFGSEEQVGKTIYVGESNKKYSLDFSREGDTYTLSAVKGTKAQNLEQFELPGEYDYIRTNNFWPMDDEQNADMHFGGDISKQGYNTKYSNGYYSQLPASDDGMDHNSYFGMYYQVGFKLDETYRGPLEYLFYGDDDMWVFLDDQLVCDIGGVHSSVGEYVDLWDYLGEFDADGNLTGVKSGKATDHVLKIFYTERGASGSSCWMQFTLPSIKTMTPEIEDDNYGTLRIDKEVVINRDNVQNIDVDRDTFTFDITLTGTKDDHPYIKYDKNDVQISNELIVWDGATFTLKNGEYIIIRQLPVGVTYTITEHDTAQIIQEGTVTTTEDSDYHYETSVSKNNQAVKEDVITDKEVNGTIIKGQEDQIKYTNKIIIYELPKTGGFGIILYTIAGALCILLGAGFMYTKKARERRV